MKSLLRVVSLVAVAMYVYFIYNSHLDTHAPIHEVGDILMVGSVVGLLLTGHKSVLLILSLVWMAFNKFAKYFHHDTTVAEWEAYNGFTIAAVLSQVAPKL